VKTSKKRVASRKKKVVAQQAALEPIVAVPVLETPVMADAAIPTSVAHAEEKGDPKPLPIKQSGRFLLIALLLGWIFDFLFWEQKVGINFALFLFVSLALGLTVLMWEGYKPARPSLWLLLPFSFFAVVAFMRREPLTSFLAFTFVLFSLGLFATNYLGGRWYLYHVSDYLHKLMLLIGDLLARPFGFLWQASREAADSDGKARALPIFGLLRGMLIALPILLCFGTLLASADVVFNQKLDDFFDGEKISEYVQRFFLIILLAYVLIGTVLHAATTSMDEKVTHEKQSFIKPFLGFTESAVVLGSVSGLFILFVIVQFQYFFGGERNIGVQGFTYSQYARRGFNELVMVAVFSLIMLVVLSTVTRRDHESQRRVYSGLSVAVVSLVMVMLVSAFQRISLAIGWHGYSRLRLYPRIFLVWLALLLITVAVLEILRRERYFTLATVLASFGFAASITLFNVDAAIVKLNVYRSWHGRNLNVAHLAELSEDAVPALADEFLGGNLPTSTREGVGAILSCYRYFEEAPHISPYDWRSFNYSSWKAHQALEEVRPELSGYVIRYKKYPVRVRTPGGFLYECRQYDPANDYDR
jgi:hypothetical protein